MEHNSQIVDGLNTLSALAYADAEQHGLYEQYMSGDMVLDEVRQKLAARIGQECAEAFTAAKNDRHYREELADIIIMTCSACGYLGIDIGKAVEDKRIANIDRPKYHTDKKKTHDAVNHPTHYNTGRYQVIDVIHDWKLGFDLGNAIKYIGRAGHKGNAVQDLKKAVWYIQHHIEMMERENDGNKVD